MAVVQFIISIIVFICSAAMVLASLFVPQYEYSSHCPIVTHIPWVHLFSKNQLQRT